MIEGDKMLIITATELKKNLGKYLTKVNKEDIVITRNGIPVARLITPKDKKLSLVNQLLGVIPNDNLSKEDIKKERLNRYESDNR